MNESAILIVQIGAFLGAVAAIVAGILMDKTSKKFGTGILAYGFKTISLGVFLITAGIIVDTLSWYIQIGNDLVFVLIALAKYGLLVAGTYVIVIGSKRTGDKLQSLTK